MRIESEEDRSVAAATLKEVMSKLEEALRLTRELESSKETIGAGEPRG